MYPNNFISLLRFELKLTSPRQLWFLIFLDTRTVEVTPIQESCNAKKKWKKQKETILLNSWSKFSTLSRAELLGIWIQLSKIIRVIVLLYSMYNVYVSGC